MKQEEREFYQNLLFLGGLLHDIGKTFERTKEEKFSHEERGWKFLSPISQEVAEYAKYHHKKSILNSPKEDFTKKLLWIVHLADCLSASERDTVENNKELNPQNPLLSIFSFLSLNNNFLEKKLAYNGFCLKEGEILFPETRKEISLSKYSEIKSLLEEFDPKISFDLWLILLERFTSFVPAMTGEKEIVSLFDHSKMTSAFSACLFQYYENEIFNDDLVFENFKEVTENEILNEENRKVFLLIGGDLSGIQKFVYGTTHHQKALLRTKGKSLYLEFLCLDVIREILKQLNLTWANVILNSGGHFYILAPNLKEVKENKVKAIKEKVNKFLYKKFGGTIYLALAYQEFSGKEIGKAQIEKFNKKIKEENKETEEKEIEEWNLKRRGETLKRIFKELHQKLDSDKSQKFKDVLLEDINEWKEKFEKENSYEDNLCQFCKLRPGEENSDGERECKECKNFTEMAKRFRVEKYEELERKKDEKEKFWLEFIEKMRYQKIGVWKEKRNSEDLPHFEFPFSRFYLRDFTENFEIKEDFKAITLINFYNFEDKEIKKKLKFLFNQLKDKKLNFLNSYFVSWYSTENAEDLDKIDKECVGLKKVAILKADVDDLGEFFRDGIDVKYRTFSSLATFSRLLDWFFKIYINWLGDIEKGLEKNICELQKSTKLKEFRESLKWREKLKKPKRDVQILYSGGDDLVIIGPWNEILDFALDLEWLFKEYVGRNPDLHFSAGMVMVDKKFPIYKAIELAEERLKKAKEEEKNKVNVFERNPVLWEKLRESFQNFSDFWEFNKEIGKAKLKYLSKSFLYKLLELKSIYFEKEKKGIIDLKPIIYIHYLLARSKEKNLKDNEVIKKYIALQRSGKPAKEFQYLDIPLIWLSYLSREK